MELINPDYKSLLDTELKLDVCTLAPKLANSNVKVYVKQPLRHIKKKTGSLSEIAVGTLVYTDDDNEEKSIAIIAKFFYYTPVDLPVDVESMLYEQRLYMYIRDHILKNNVSPNFIGYIGDGTCTQQATSELLPYEHEDLSDISVLLTQYIGQQTLSEFLRDGNNAESYDIVCSIFFQCFYIFLVLEHFSIQHNDSHTGNIRVETLPRPVSLCYTINRKKYIINTRHIAYIYDWDLAYCAELGVNPKIMNWFNALFIANKMIHKRDMSYTVGHLIGYDADNTLFAELNNHFTETFNESILYTIQSFKHFDRYTQQQATSRQVFCFGQDIKFKHVMGQVPNYVVGCTDELADGEDDSFARIIMDKYAYLIANTEHVKLNECTQTQFRFKCDFKNLKSFEFIRYSSEVSLKRMLSCLKNAQGIERITLVLYGTNIDNIFEFVHTYARGVKSLTVYSTEPHDNPDDLRFLKILPKLEHLSITSKDKIQRNDRTEYINILKQYDQHPIVYDDSKEMFRKAFLDNVERFSDIIWFVRTIYFFFQLRDELIIRGIATGFTDKQIFDCCVYYIFVRDEFASKIPDVNICLPRVMEYIKESGINIADTVTPIDFCYYLIFVRNMGLTHSEDLMSFFKACCLSICQGLINNILAESISMMDISLRAVVNVDVNTAVSEEDRLFKDGEFDEKYTVTRGLIR